MSPVTDEPVAVAPVVLEAARDDVLIIGPEPFTPRRAAPLPRPVGEPANPRRVAIAAALFVAIVFEAFAFLDGSRIATVVGAVVVAVLLVLLTRPNDPHALLRPR